MSHRRRQHERGSVSVLVAAVLMMAGVLVLASVDLMRALEAKARAQTAADAAALSAAQEMARPSSMSPADIAAEYAERNRARLVGCECPRGGSEATIRVEVRVRLVFVGPDRTVTGRAGAVIEGR